MSMSRAQMTCSSMIPGFYGTEYSTIRSFPRLVFALQIGLRHLATVLRSAATAIGAMHAIRPSARGQVRQYVHIIRLLSFPGTPPGTKMIG